ncbi:MAG TPA: lipocalin-like domain-containing protein [Candidatus Acidoferrales bacterium]|nr:lipocalin-like domain-containing protein [Candidatus Acidoferrales bacterium]
MNSIEESKFVLDDETKEHVANVLWFSDFNSADIPHEITEQLYDPKNSPESFGSRTRTYLDWLINHPQSHNPDYTKRYQKLKKYCITLNSHQSYVIISKFLGLNDSQGFVPMPAAADLQFPRDLLPQLKTKVGWHFFVGSCWDNTGAEYGVECMFFRYSLLPPALAAEFGLSDVQNQVIELQLAISKAGDQHYQADPPVIAGTTGLISLGLNPFHFEVGKNKMASVHADSLFPFTLEACGFERSSAEPIKLAIDLRFESGKEYLIQGENGCMPCVAGLGSLYYSIPNMKLANGSTLTIGSERITLTHGTFWFDHQWGFLIGNSQSTVLRAATNMKKTGNSGWDWFMAQFSGDRQLTMFAPHSDARMAYYYQTGSSPPGTMHVNVSGKYMDEHKELKLTRGTLSIRRWVRGEHSPNPLRYPPSRTWYPNQWEFVFDDVLPEDIRAFTMVPILSSGQSNFMANGSEYSEGAVYLRGTNGEDLGRGFAESVEYARTIDAMLMLAGIDDASIGALILNSSSSWLRRLRSRLYVLTHTSELRDVLATQKGLELFTMATSKSR